MTPLGPLGPVSSMPFGPITAPDRLGAADAPAQTPDGGFAGMLSGAIKSLNGELVSSEHLSEQAATGQLADPTVALVAVEKADLAFQTAVQVRNKLVEGWQEISRMTV